MKPSKIFFLWVIVLALRSVVTFGQDTCSERLIGGDGYYGTDRYDTCHINLSQKIKIPVIFHVVYKNEEENIASDLLKKELEDLKKDFLMLNHDTSEVLPAYKSSIGNPNIEFYLAEEKFNGSPENGIIRVERNRLQKPAKASKIIRPDKYLNVYVYTRFHNGAHTPPLPWDNPEQDAIFVSYVEIGRGYRILTHEAGHWLGLLHIYESENCNDLGDGVDDTPSQLYPSDGKFLIKKNDQTLFPVNCLGNPGMYQNFMDYSYFRRMFTAGQVKRMRIVIANKRKLLCNN